MAFAQNLNHLMQVKGLTNYQLSKDLDVHATSITNWLSDNSKPIKRMQVRLADYFGITIDELMGDELPEPGIKKEPAPNFEGELTETQREAMELVKSMSDDQLRVFIATLKAARGM